MSLISKSSRGVQKMDPTGEKVKIIKLKEEQDPITNQIANLGLNKEKWDKMSSNEKLQAVDKNRFIPVSTRIQAAKMEWDDLVKRYDGVRQGFAFPTKTQSIRPGIGDAIQKKLTKETLMKMIQEELKEMFDGMEPMDRTGLDEVDIYGITGNPKEEKSRRDASIKKSKYEPINPALAKATKENEKLDMLLNQDIDVIVKKVERNPDLGLKLLGRARKTKPSFVSALKTALEYK
jgi:hypothetical protein